MNPRRWLTWQIFAVCALAVVEGLGWVTWQSLRLERREQEARAQARLQELVRLALWRMESEITPILAQEASRPYFQYQAFYPAERAYTRMWEEVQPGEVLVPSPLLEGGGAYTRLYFQVQPDGTVTSPQAPTGAMRQLAESKYVDPELLLVESGRLEELRSFLRAPDQPARSIATGSPGPLGAEPPRDGSAELDELTPKIAAPPSAPKTFADSLELSKNEYLARQQSVQTANLPQEQARARKGAPPAPAAELAAAPAPAPAPSPVPGPPLEQALSTPNAAESQPAAAPVASELAKKDRRDERGVPALSAPSGPEPASPAPAPPSGPPVSDVRAGGFLPVWVTNPQTAHPELILQRRVELPGGAVTQGMWMDWPRLRQRLLAVSADLLPGAAIKPITDAAAARAPAAPSALLLASIPAVVVPGPIPPAGLGAMDGPQHATLILTWAAVLGGVLAIGIVLRKSMDLSDRRGRFVSAVTHELRTPLTTFCLYTEMLETGMVPAEASRGYLRTLHEQSRRLAGIVENVLEYARLGGRRVGSHITRVPAADLLARIRPALQACVDRCGMTLEVQTAPAVEGREVRADPATVERILINLVDNACKYAAGSPDRRVHLSLAPSDRAGCLDFRVRDHGPGIPRHDERRIFLPFQRGEHAADGSTPGLGLGLALARGLSRHMGGDLSLARHPAPGAEFRLRLREADLTNSESA
jgi:signal transduction histidine kinase